MSLTLTQKDYDAMIAHAQSQKPLESCGYLAGKEGKIEKFYPMTNIDQSPEHFTFDPKEQFATVKDARTLGLKLLAVYHSHPETPARLSEEDLALFNDPEPVYIIVSLMNTEPDVKGYHVVKPSAHEIEISRVPLNII